MIIDLEFIDHLELTLIKSTTFILSPTSIKSYKSSEPVKLYVVFNRVLNGRGGLFSQKQWRLW